MNERIQELAVKAKLMAEEDINRQISYNTELKAFAGKFAELLIKECAMLVEGFTIEQEVALDDYQEYEASTVLKEHFGVEE